MRPTKGLLEWLQLKIATGVELNGENLVPQLKRLKRMLEKKPIRREGGLRGKQN